MSYIFNIFIILGLYLFIGILWNLLEMLMYQNVTPRAIDDIITAILAISTYFNIKYLDERGDKL